MNEELGSLAARIADAARLWWEAHRPGGEGERRGDPSAFARLRRAARTVDALAEPATIALWRMLPEDWRRTYEREEKLARTAALAHVLAFVREDTPGVHPMRALGPERGEKPERAKLKPMRLRRLLAAREPDELAQAFRRLVALADRRIDVGEVAVAVLLWSDAIRTRWAFAWHDAGWASPGGAEIPAEAA